MSRNLISRRAAVVAGAVLTGVLGVAGPAWADVTVSPASAPQGSGVNLTFTVTNKGTSPIGRVKMTVPEDNPVAEVFPLSVDDWAPQIVQRRLTRPLTGVMESNVTQAPASITWFAVPGKEIRPGASAQLRIALGPLPQTSDLTLGFEPTYTGGATGPGLPSVTLRLTPGDPSTNAAGMQSMPGMQMPGMPMGGATAGPATAEDQAFAAYLDEQEQQGPGFWSVAGWVLAALAAAAAGVMYWRGRHREEPGDDEPGENGDDEPAETADAQPDDTQQTADGEKEPAAAGAPRVSPWSYRDGPGA